MSVERSIQPIGNEHLDRPAELAEPDLSDFRDLVQELEYTR